jgi:hypothetical protein
MDQHVISAWHLRAFAGRGRGAQVVQVFDKATDVYADVRVDEFLAEADAHSPEVELDIAHLEDPAARAARTLVKRARALPGGFYAVMGPDAAVQTAGPALSDEGVIEGMRLLVGRHEIPSPNTADRLALANYVALMYQRSPKGEAARVEFRIVYERAAQTILDRMMPGMRSGLDEAASERRARMLRNALDMGPILARANWWIVRAGAPEAFVLGDHPVVTTVSLGHDDTWRPIFAEATFVVAMPLGPAVGVFVGAGVCVGAGVGVGGGVAPLKVTATATFVVGVRVQVEPWPEQGPVLHPPNLEPGAAVAVRTSCNPEPNRSEQLVPQEMPRGLLTTVPEPSPNFEILTATGLRSANHHPELVTSDEMKAIVW